MRNITRVEKNKEKLWPLSTALELMEEIKAACCVHTVTNWDMKQKNCFALKGYLEWWGDRPSGEGRKGIGRGKGLSSGRGGGQTHKNTH